MLLYKNHSIKTKAKCNKYGELGHFKKECKTKEGTNLFTKGDFSASSFMFHQIGELENDDETNIGAEDKDNDNLNNNSYSYLLTQPLTSKPTVASTNESTPQSWIILDNDSTVDVFCNVQIQQKVHEVSHGMRIHCNAGTSITKLKGELNSYGEVWYNPQGIANALSLFNMTKKFRVTFDNAYDERFKIHKPDSTHQYFHPSEDGLFYLDTADKNADVIVLLDTVKDNTKKFGKSDVMRAHAARKLESTMEHPPLRKFIDIVKHNLLLNCTVTIQDIINTAQLKIFP